MDTVKVVFRTWRTTGEVVALFPEIPACRIGHNCMSYTHAGKHSSVSPDIGEFTNPSSPQESLPLKTELEKLGYKLAERKKITRQMTLARYEAARA